MVGKVEIKHNVGHGYDVTVDSVPIGDKVKSLFLEIQPNTIPILTVDALVNECEIKETPMLIDGIVKSDDMCDYCDRDKKVCLADDECPGFKGRMMLNL